MGAGLGSAFQPPFLIEDGPSSPAHSLAPELRGKPRQVSCSVLCLAKNKEQAGSPCLYCCQTGALKSEIKYSKT